jgi:hypothetical protein
LGPRRTKPLRLQNIRFFLNNMALDLLGPMLRSETAISITFEFQKTDIRHETVHQHATILPNLCPVKAWAKVVLRVLSYPGCNTDSLVSTVLTKNCFSRCFLPHDSSIILTGRGIGCKMHWNIQTNI